MAALDCGNIDFILEDCQAIESEDVCPDICKLRTDIGDLYTSECHTTEQPSLYSGLCVSLDSDQLDDTSVWLSDGPSLELEGWSVNSLDFSLMETETDNSPDFTSYLHSTPAHSSSTGNFLSSFIQDLDSPADIILDSVLSDISVTDEYCDTSDCRLQTPGSYCEAVEGGRSSVGLRERLLRHRIQRRQAYRNAKVPKLAL